MNIKYVSPSYKRPNDCPILDYLSKVKVYVSKEDYKDYVLLHKKKKDNIIQVPDGVQGKGKGTCLAVNKRRNGNVAEIFL